MKGVSQMPADIHRARYLLPKFSKNSYAVLMKTINNSLILESSDAAAFRLHVLGVYYQHGWKAVISAFKISKSTLYRWKHRYEQSQKRLYSLVPVSTKPHKLRSMQTDSRLVAFISSIRNEYGNLSKYKIKSFLDEYAKQLDITPIGITTIGKIIKRKHLFIKAKKRYAHKKYGSFTRVKHSPKETTPGYLEMDSITLMVMGRRWCFTSIIDVVTKVATVTLTKSLTAKSAQEALELFIRNQRYLPRTVQTDNGSEFLGEFHKYLETNNIKHQFIYPRSPKINGVVERFNRTIQEEFINRSDEIFYDQAAFVLKLNKYLIWYNTRRPHYALKFKTPFEVHNQLINFPKCG
jgi:hypothetical protein